MNQDDGFILSILLRIPWLIVQGSDTVTDYKVQATQQTRVTQQPFVVANYQSIISNQWWIKQVVSLLIVVENCEYMLPVFSLFLKRVYIHLNIF
jgi:hypothetical protein